PRLRASRSSRATGADRSAGAARRSSRSRAGPPPGRSRSGGRGCAAAGGLPRHQCDTRALVFLLCDGYGQAVHAVVHAAQAFFDHLAAVEWKPLGIGVGLYLLRVSARPVAWRNIIAAAYPESRVPLSRIFGAYWVGVAVNSVV